MFCKNLLCFARICKNLLCFVRICNVLQEFAMFCKNLLCFARICYVKDRKAKFSNILLCDGPKTNFMQDFAMWRIKKLGFVRWREATYVLNLAKSLFREACYALHLTNSHLRKATYVLPRKVTSVLIKEWLCFLSMIIYFFLL